jgi:hypothetical protein
MSDEYHLVVGTGALIFPVIYWAVGGFLLAANDDGKVSA